MVERNELTNKKHEFGPVSKDGISDRTSYYLRSFIFVHLFIYKMSLKVMETVLIQINNNKAYKLLEDLEDLQIIKVLKKSIQPQQKLSEKYAGKLPSDASTGT